MKIGEKTRERILKEGLKLWPDVTLEAVAKAVGLKTHVAVLYHFPNDSLKAAVAEYAVEIGHSPVIVQLMAAKHPAADKLSAADRIRHFNEI